MFRSQKEKLQVTTFKLVKNLPLLSGPRVEFSMAASAIFRSSMASAGPAAAQ
jgi:hypothetical protein